MPEAVLWQSLFDGKSRMDKMKVRNSMLLLLTATIWGVAFVAQSVGMEYVGPLTFNCVRSLIGGLVLIPCIWFLGRMERRGEKREESRNGKKERKDLLAGGVLCGILLCVASNFQQMGIVHTSVGKAGFITACYIIIVPVLGIFLRRRCGLNVWLGVLFALAGLYFLCVKGNASDMEVERLVSWLPVGKGEILLIICALLFSVHILVIDYFTVRADGVKMSCIQFFVCGILSGLGMLLAEEPQIAEILRAWQPILYAGVMSCGVAYTLQIVGQKGMNPTVASLILSLESVISVLAGMVLLSQKLSRWEIFGCVLMFAAIILAQLPGKEKAGSEKTVSEEARNQKIRGEEAGSEKAGREESGAYGE